MGDYDLIIILILIGGFILFYFLSASGALGDGLKDVFGPVKKIADTAGGLIEGVGNQLGIVPGDQKEGEACEKQKLACGAGLVCKDKICVKATAKIGEQCTPGKVSTGAIVASTFSWLVPPVGAATTAGMAASGQYAKKGGVECESGAQCVQGICHEEPKAAGDPCYPDDLKCPSGLRCFPRTGWGKCYKDKGTTGDLCIIGDYVRCGEDHTCITPDNSTIAGTQGVCTPNRGQVEGGVCKSSGSNTVECGKDLACVNSKCYRMPKKAGDNCATGTNLKCPGTLRCWPRDGSLAKCYNNPADKGEGCVTGNQIICKGSLKCSVRDGINVGMCE